MSTEPDYAERVARSLQTQVEHLHRAPLTLPDVRRRARRIRGVRVAIGSAAVAVVAAIVVVPLASGGSGDQHDSLPTVTQPSPITESVDPAGPPRIGYAIGHVYVAPDGTRTTLDVLGTLTSVTPYAGGWVTTSDEPGSRGFGSDFLTFLNASGHPTRQTCTNTLPVVSATYIAWTEHPGCVGPVMRPATLHRARLDGSEPSEQRVPGHSRVAGITGDRVVLTTGANSVSSTDLVSPPVPIPDLASADAVLSTGVVVGRPSHAAHAGIHTAALAVDLATGAQLWADQVSAHDPSPDGVRLLATSGIYLGGYSPQYVVSAATGASQNTIARTGGTAGSVHIDELAWENDAYLLGVLLGPDSAHLVRVDLDGRIVWRGPGIATSSDASLVLATTP